MNHQTTLFRASEEDTFEIELSPCFKSVPMSEMSVDTSSYERSNSECLIGGDFWSTSFSDHGLEPPTSSGGRARRRHTWNSSPRERFTWKIKALRPIPMYHPLERSAVTVDNLTVDEVVRRVSKFLRINSIAAVYHKDRAECSASTGLKFVVQLWKGQSDGTVVLEIQRRQGCSFQMRRIRQYLVTEVRNGEQGDRRRSLWSFSKTPSARLCKHLERKLTCSPSDSINMAIKLLSSRCADQNELGLESLAMSTNVATAQKAEAVEVARALVCGDGKRARQMRDLVAFYFCNTEESPDESPDAYTSDEDDSDMLSEQCGYAQGRHFGRMHNLAVTTLLNSLTTLPAGSEEKHIVDHRSYFWRWVIEALVYNVEVADSRPQEAAKSAACLKLLLRLCPAAANIPILEERLPVALCQAHEVGKACHLKLERDAEDLMRVISRTE